MGCRYKLEGIFFRHYIAYAENPSKFPARKFHDHGIGPPVPGSATEFLIAERANLNLSAPVTLPDVASSSDEDAGDLDSRPVTLSTQIRRQIAPLIETLWSLANIGQEAANELELRLQDDIDEMDEWLQLKYGNGTPVEELHIGKRSHRRPGERRGDGSKPKKQMIRAHSSGS